MRIIEAVLQNCCYSIKRYIKSSHLVGLSIFTQAQPVFAEYCYAYNEWGWLTNSTAPLFAMQLKYNDGTRPQYNGNITNQNWGTPNSLSNGYTYSYDYLNRLRSGIATTNNTEKSITYDNLGNITGLERYVNNVKIDGLKLDYIDGSSNPTNKLFAITDSTSNDAGLKHGTFTYAYDGNGNMVTDNSKSLNTTYNLLNLPDVNTITSAGTITILMMPQVER